MPRVEAREPSEDGNPRTQAGKATDQKPTLMLLDGNSLAFRAFYALPAENFKTQGGLTTNAVYGFTAMLINLLRDEAAQRTSPRRSTCRGRPSARRSTRSTRPAGRRRPTSSAARSTSPRKCSARWASPCSPRPGFEADDMIATLATQAENEGYRVLVVTGDRDSLQLVSDDVTVLYPRKGVSELTRFTPEAVRREVRADARSSTPTSPRCAAIPATTCPASPAWGRRPRPSGSPSTARCRRWSTTSTRCAARSATRCAPTCPASCCNRELTDLVKDVPLAQTPDTLRMQPWDRDQIHRLFDDLEFRVLRDRLFETLAAVDPEVDEGFDVRGGALEPGELAAWLAEHSHGQPVRAGRRRHPPGLRRRRHRAGHRRRRRRGRATSTPPTLDSRRRGRAGVLAGRPGAAQGAARGQAGDARPGRAGLDAGRRHLRHRAGGLPGAARAAQLRPRRPVAALPAPRTARGKP